MNKKYLIVCGDSFTEGHVMGEKASWAYWVAKKMNLELINLSCGGMGNEWISSTLISYLNTMDIPFEECIVMVGWSDLARQLVFMDKMDNQDEGTFSLVPGDLIYPSDNLEYDSRLKWIWKNRNSLLPFFSNIQWYLYRTYQSLFFTKTYLKSNNIPFLFFDVITDNKVYHIKNEIYLKNSWKDFTQDDLEIMNVNDEIINNMISEKNVNFIFDKNYITFENKPILGWLKNEGNYIYEEGNDGHTNILGAEKISEFIINNFKQIYK